MPIPVETPETPTSQAAGERPRPLGESAALWTVTPLLLMAATRSRFLPIRHGRTVTDEAMRFARTSSTPGTGFKAR